MDNLAQQLQSQRNLFVIVPFRIWKWKILAWFKHIFNKNICFRESITLLALS